MVYRFGLIGPEPSVQKMLSVAQEQFSDCQWLPFPYVHVQESKALIENHHQEVNGWLFSGPIPYHYAREFLGSDANIVYCKPTGASLYKALLQLAMERKELTTNISIDMIDSEDLDFKESFLEAGIPTEAMYMKMFNGPMYDNPDVLVQFHLDLWKQGKTNAALTCMNLVYSMLRDAGMPAYRIQMTKLDIRQALRVMREQAKSSYFKEMQIGVEIIEIDQFDQLAEKTLTRYHLQHLELKAKQQLLQLCEKIDGTLMDIGNGRYQIFSSRGAIEREIGALRDTVHAVSLEADVPVAVGIGFGSTAFSAENNARRALQHAKEKEERGIVIIQQDGVIIESVGEEDELAYAYRSHDKELLDKLNQGNVSIKTFKKITALVHRMGWEEFTTSDLSSQLSMTQRNAQRIMMSLCELGLAEVGGEELQAVRGRPRKLYRLIQS
ncbi:hypothetical protein [Paenibacillus rigui]|uniref:Transcriptional regulator n=1 Tax=Paenibacillus rigui TaxID=554312 RepID=A0A229UKW2_9BACL|nr:hypothetical protein [Paenibacillus rigui]OXM84050.1 hypothetical protein CF651_22670 [Paenibacillus rigui]